MKRGKLGVRCRGGKKFHDRAVVASLKRSVTSRKVALPEQFHDRAVVASLKLAAVLPYHM